MFDFASPASMDFGVGMAIYNFFSLLATVFLTPVFLGLVALVLYYFTGEKKKADEFMSNLMGHSIRIFSYVWFFISTLIVFSGLTSVFYFFFSAIVNAVNAAERYADDPDGGMLLGGILLTLVGILFSAITIYLHRYVNSLTNSGGNVSYKLLLVSGLIVYSIISFVSFLSIGTNLVEFVQDADYGIDPGSWAMLFSAIIIFAVFIKKSLMVLKREIK